MKGFIRHGTPAVPAFRPAGSAPPPRVSMLRRAGRVLVLLLIVALLALVAAEWDVSRAATGRCYAVAEDVPERTVGLVLGTSKTLPDGHANLFYRSRIEAAARLFAVGRVRWLIVSGNQEAGGYDEPSTMRADLIELGVPAERIYRDYAGFRTLDSMARAARVFGLRQVTVISQRFHNERAIYLAQAWGVDAVALDAADVTGWNGVRSRIREWFARAAAVLDVRVRDRQPRFLGPPVRIGEDPPT